MKPMTYISIFAISSVFFFGSSAFSADVYSFGALFDEARCAASYANAQDQGKELEKIRVHMDNAYRAINAKTREKHPTEIEALRRDAMGLTESLRYYSDTCPSSKDPKTPECRQIEQSIEKKQTLMKLEVHNVTRDALNELGYKLIAYDSIDNFVFQDAQGYMYDAVGIDPFGNLALFAGYNSPESKLRTFQRFGENPFSRFKNGLRIDARNQKQSADPRNKQYEHLDPMTYLTQIVITPSCKGKIPAPQATDQKSFIAETLSKEGWFAPTEPQDLFSIALKHGAFPGP